MEDVPHCGLRFPHVHAVQTGALRWLWGGCCCGVFYFVGVVVVVVGVEVLFLMEWGCCGMGL